MTVLAAIDLGSHAVRLATVEVSELGWVRRAAFNRWPLPLGQLIFSRGGVGTAQQDQLIAVCEDVAGRLSRMRVTAYRAVATAALRQARNHRAVIAQIRRATGVRVELISGMTEGRMSRDALVRAMGTPAADTLVLDLGGGSLEIFRVGGGLRRSLPCGTARLVERFPELNRPTSAKQLRQLERAIHEQLRRRVTRYRARQSVGTGGNLTALAELVPGPLGFFPAIDVSGLRGATHRIAQWNTTERMTRLGIRADRAVGIVPAAVVLAAVCRHFRVGSVVIPGTGLRETILRELSAATEPEQRARQWVGRLRRRRGPGQSLLAIALRLFDLLAPIHGLWAAARAPLATAALDLASETDRGKSRQATLDVSRLAPPVQQVVAQAVAIARGAVAPSRSDKRRQPVATVLGALLRTARFLVDRGGRPVAIDLARCPVTLDCQLGRSRPGDVAEQLAEALGVAIRIR